MVETWKVVLLILAVLWMFVSICFLIKRLDKTIYENRKKIEKGNEKQEPSCIMLTEDMSEEEITAEVLRFREKHKNTRVVLYDDNEFDINQN